MKDADKALMDRLNTLIELNFDHPAFGTEDICRELGVSRSHLYRVVKEHTQLSTSLYIRHIKLIKAKEWLQSPDMKIAEIAYKLGIDSPQNFSKYFTKEFGLTPTDYRKNHAAMPVAEQAVVPETVEEPVLPLASNRKVTTTRKYLYMGLGLLCLLAVGLTAFLLKTKMKDEPVFPENSIAIMPFKNMGSRERLLFRRTDAASTPGNFSAFLPQVNVGGVTIVKMKGGKIAREQDFTDNLEFMQQLGVIPR